MSDVKITLTGEAADRLLRLVAAEKYARPEDAIADALEALEASRDPALDGWLRGVILARADALAADPARGLTAERARSRLFGA